MNSTRPGHVRHDISPTQHADPREEEGKATGARAGTEKRGQGRRTPGSRSRGRGMRGEIGAAGEEGTGETSGRRAARREEAQ